MFRTKGYDADVRRADITDRSKISFSAVQIRSVTIKYERTRCNQHNPIEHVFGHHKINRIITSRYARLAKQY